MKTGKGSWAMAALVAMGVGVHSASANSITTVTVSSPTGSTIGGTDNTGNGGQPVDAQAMFTFSAGHLEIDLTNLLNNPTSVGQAIVGLAFSISGPGSSSTPTGITDTGALISFLNNSDTPSAFAGDTATELGKWQLVSSPSPDFFKLSGTSANDPAVIGFGNGGLANSPYTAAGGSIINGAHNPFVQGTLTFNMNIAGLTDASDVNSVQFLFNTNFTSFDATGSGRTPSGGGQVTPVPASFWGGSALMAGLLALRRIKCKPA